MGAFTELSLFSGGGGGLLATKHLLGWRTVCYVEKDKLCQAIIKARIADGYLDDAPIWDDVQTFDGRPWRGLVDVVTGGFPCQPYSRAGKKLGAEDERNMWPDTIRIIREVQPRWLLLENVSTLLSYDYVKRIFADLSESGFDCRWQSLSAFEVGAPHLRERLWIVSNANDGRSVVEKDVEKVQANGGGRDVDRSSWWQAEPAMGRVAHGLPRGMGQQLVPLGNAQVPAVVRRAWNSSVIEITENP
jgi:DNA (cytosine-5)-methyltransferase 1